MTRLRDAVRTVLEAYDIAGRRIRAYAAEPVVPAPMPTIGDEQQRQLARDEQRQAFVEDLRARCIASAAQLAELQARIAQAEADAALERELAEREQHRRAAELRRRQGVQPS
jgi:hypothetical protein